MSANNTKFEGQPQHQADAMSAASQEPPKEVRPAIPTVPTFSYAQAAKGKAPTVPTTPSASTVKSNSIETGAKKDIGLEAITSTSDAKHGSGKRTPTDEEMPQGYDLKAVGEPGPTRTTVPNGSVKDPAASGLTLTKISAPELPSASPSSDFGTVSIPTLPKDEDGFSAANGSSESTWDKQSQSSHNGSKNGEKANTEKETAQKVPEASWDEEKPEPASQKEAPPPPVNVWQQRMALNLKAKSQSSAPQQSMKPASLSNGVGVAGESVKVTDSSGEPRKQENKRKSKGNTEDRSTVKEGSKLTDGKVKSGEGASKANAIIMAPPPPPGDAISWPTPESAVEEKKKVQSRVEKDDKEKTPTSKSHGKKEWQPVDFVPTVSFNTPMPTSRTRGGRGSGGATREGGGRGRINQGVDKVISTGASLINQSPLGNEERGKTASSSSTAAPTTQKAKRASSAGPATVKELRKPGDASGLEKRKDFDSNSKSNQNKTSGANEARRQSATVLNESQGSKSLSGRPLPREAVNAQKKVANTDDARHATDVTSNAQAPIRNSDAEKKKEGFMRPQDSGKDPHANTSQRDRGDGRSERGGRGGYRGRGGSNFNSYNAHSPNGHGLSGPTQQFQQPMVGPPARSFSNHERVASQSQGPYYATTSHQPRAYRSNSRSHSIQHQIGRSSHQQHAGPPHLANLQTELANSYGYPFDPQSGSMSALPYNAYMPPPNLFGMVGMQIDYYFSIDNLCKDTYLRKNMNSQGWVPLELIAGFNRIKQLTLEIGIVRDVCFTSNVVEARIAQDETIWLRAREDWEQWVMDMDTRVPSARNDGPQFTPFQSFNAYGGPHASNDGHEVSPRSGAASLPPENIQYQSLDSAAGPVDHIVTVPPQQQTGTYGASQAPLSAAVSDFSPSVRSANNRVFSSPDPHAQGTRTTSDDEMDKLIITFRTKQPDEAPPSLQAIHSASSRTFSNGSIDGTSVRNELVKSTEPQLKPTLNGDNPESIGRFNATRSRSPFSVDSPSRQTAVSSPVLWYQDKEHLPRVNSLPTEYTHACYPPFRQGALSQRDRVTDTCVHDMQVLYGFWAHYLIHNFNLHTYEDFHRMAIEDESKRQSNFGMKCLIQYYDEALLGQRTIPNDNVAADFVEIVKKESPKTEGPIFQKLRAAWRNGAWNAKNRSRISKSIDADLTVELDK